MFPRFSNKKNAGIGRSESFRQRRESRPSFRKRSDPNIPRSKSDVEVDDKSASNLNHSGSSSNSSLSNRSLDSPSTSSDMVHRTTNATTDSANPVPSAPPLNLLSPLVHTSSNATSSNHYDDSDLDIENDSPNWQENVDAELLKLMKPKEKKRQDVINELFHTERTHVRNLKVLDRIFYKPLLQEQLLPSEFVHFLFPNLEEVIDIHSCFNNKMKMRRKEEEVIGDIGDLMLEMFDGAAGEHLKRAAATCCQNHSIALETLKFRQKKEQKLAQFLADAELHHLCRRLQLKDIIASGFQRITKYPLFLENIAKYTPPNTQELSNLQRCVECSKDILVYVDSAIREAVNLHKLSDIQKKLEKTAFEKIDHKIVHSFKNLDVTKHKLVHEGQLMWRLNKQKTIEMYVVLLEDILVLLQKQDEKYILKFHNTNLTSGREDTKIMHSPLLRVQNLLIKNNATDERSIFVISSSELHAMYEFVAGTATEKKRWCRHLTEAVEGTKNHTGNLHKQESPYLVPAEDVSHDEVSNKESQNKENSKAPKLTNDSIESTDSVSSPQSSFDATSEASTNQPSDKPPLPEAPTSPVAADDGATTQSKGPKRLQRVEILKIADGPQLIEPCEVIVSHGAILQTAEPVLTPIERLRRKDQEIASAIQEKEKLVSDMMQLSEDDLKQISVWDEDNENKDARELAVSAVCQGNQLSLLLSESLNAAVDPTVVHSSDEMVYDTSPSEVVNSVKKSAGVPVLSTEKLLTLSVSLNKKLTQLLAVITDVEAERMQLRKELINAKDQIHLMHEVHRHCSVRSQSPSNYSQSRPNSFVSIGSSVSEDVPDVSEEHSTTVLNKVIEEPDSGDSPSESTCQTIDNSLCNTDTIDPMIPDGENDNCNPPTETIEVNCTDSKELDPSADVSLQPSCTSDCTSASDAVTESTSTSETVSEPSCL